VIAEEIARYAVRLSAMSRPSPTAPEFITKWVKWGGGLRASQALDLASLREVEQREYCQAEEGGDPDIRAVLLNLVLKREREEDHGAEAAV